MQGTLLEDCAAKFYQKYSHTNIELKCNLMHLKIYFY